MSAGLTSSDSMFSVCVTPWHGLGAVLDRPPASVAEAIEAAGLCIACACSPGRITGSGKSEANIGTPSPQA